MKKSRWLSKRRERTGEQGTRSDKESRRIITIIAVAMVMAVFMVIAVVMILILLVVVMIVVMAMAGVTIVMAYASGQI